MTTNDFDYSAIEKALELYDFVNNPHVELYADHFVLYSENYGRFLVDLTDLLHIVSPSFDSTGFLPDKFASPDDYLIILESVIKRLKNAKITVKNGKTIIQFVKEDRAKCLNH